MFVHRASMLPLREMKFAQAAMKLTYLAIMSRDACTPFALRAMKPSLCATRWSLATTGHRLHRPRSP
jgi:hypothetical protein